MNKKTWDLYAPIYKRAMKADQKIYDFMYERIPEMVKDKEVLELATGPGLLAKHIAPAAKTVLATDYSDGMIAEATVIGKICASDHALNATEEMSALNEGLKKFFEAHRAACPNYRKLEKDAGKYI